MVNNKFHINIKEHLNASVSGIQTKKEDDYFQAAFDHFKRKKQKKNFWGNHRE
jgi:hypothetical protein